MMVSHRILLRMRNVSDKNCTENQKHIACLITFFFFVNHVIYKMTWKNMGQPDGPQMTIQNSAFELHPGKLRLQTHSEYVILIAFPLQQWSRKRALMWRYTCTACLFITSFVQSTSGYNFRKITLSSHLLSGLPKSCFSTELPTQSRFLLKKLFP
jgi:hypothetical protein